MSDTPRTDEAICWGTNTLNDGEYVRADAMRELERELAARGGRDFAMTDFEATRLCVEALGLTADMRVYSGTFYFKKVAGRKGRRLFDPFTDDALAMALVKRFDLAIWGNSRSPSEWKWHAQPGDAEGAEFLGHGDTANRAIAMCIAAVQKHSTTDS